MRSGIEFSGIRRNDEWRLTRLERKIDLILTHLGLEPNQGVDAEIAAFMKAGKKNPGDPVVPREVRRGTEGS